MKLTARTKLLGATLGAAAAIAATAAPASASDQTINLYVDGVLKVHATYDDLTDNLCVTVYGSSSALGEVGMGPVTAGRYEGTRVSNWGGAGKYCSGNQSIPEDVYSEMQVRFRSASGVWTYSAKKTFYT